MRVKIKSIKGLLAVLAISILYFLFSHKKDNPSPIINNINVDYEYFLTI